MHQFIAGRLRGGTSADLTPVLNPATGEVVENVQLAGPADVDAAVAAARRAFPDWSRAAPAERAEVLIRLAALLTDRADGFARAETRQTGKPIKLSTEFDVPGTIDNVAFRARAAGAKVVRGGETPGGELARGAYYEPTLVVDAGQDAEIVRQEVFGPVLVALVFDTDDEAIRLANDTPYGLAASVWTGSAHRAMRASRDIRAGCVWVNDHIQIISEMPHGGYGASGFGKDMSVYSLAEYTNVKHVMHDLTGAVRKDWHRTIFGDRNEHTENTSTNTEEPNP